MIFTLYGDYIRHVGGSIWVGSLIQLLGRFGMSEQSVRSTILRMSRGGWLQVERLNGKSYYSLTPQGWKLLDEGAARIFQFRSRQESWDHQWRLVAYSIPEVDREKRERLRRELGYLGFGPLTSALWVSPHDRQAEVERVTVQLDLCGHLEFFTANHNGFSDRRTLVRHCWDLAQINAEYAAFVEKYQPLFEDCRGRGLTIEPSECFVRRFLLIHEYRRFPFIDPELPQELLPEDWHGQEAADLFHNYHALLADKANAFFHAVFVGPPSTAQRPSIEIPTLAPAPREKSEPTSGMLHD